MRFYKRHFGVLMHKNYISWKRRPVCSVCELVFPPLLMLVLVISRMYIPLQKTNKEALKQYKHPVFPALEVDKNKFGALEWKYDKDATNQREGEFMKYFEYTPNIPNRPHIDYYNIRVDWMGPLYFSPDQCMKRTSFMVPKRASPIIAMINHNNTV